MHFIFTTYRQLYKICQCLFLAKEISSINVLSTFIQYKTLAENITGHKILFLSTDDGGKFTSTYFNKFCKDSGNQRHCMIPYDRARNEVSERKNCTLVESACCILQVAKLPNSFWAEEIAIACYLQHLSYTKALSNSTSHYLWTGTRPNLTHLRISGCMAYTHVRDHKRNKLDIKSLKCTFIGYGKPTSVKGYGLYNPHSRLILLSRDVIFSQDTLLQIDSPPLYLDPTPASSNFYSISDQSLGILPKPKGFLQKP